MGLWRGVMGWVETVGEFTRIVLWDLGRIGGGFWEV